MRTLAFVPAILAALSAFAASPDRSNNSVVIVEINGTKITLSDFEQKNPTALFQARTAFYEAEQKVVADYVDQYLLEDQAKKEHLTVAELLDKHVNQAIAKDPSEEALHVYFEGVDTKEPYEAVRGKIIEALRQRRMTKLKADYLQNLRGQAKISFRVAAPRVEAALKSTPVRGPADARVVLVEYADYECPYCQQVQPTLDKLEAEFKGKLAFAYKDMPLPMHPNAPKAAEATRCAEAQGKYWEYHDRLEQTKQLEVPALKEAARFLQLNTETFDKCLDSGEQAARVQSYATEAQTLGVTGTPSFLLNGRFYSGMLSYENFRQIIEEELNGASASSAPESRQHGQP